MFEPLSKEFLLNRGFCCQNGCLNCPYEKENNMKQTKFEEWCNNYLKDNPYIVHPNIDLMEKSWNACKKEVLKILSTPLKNLDLSEDECDTRYIEKIEKL